MLAGEALSQWLQRAAGTTVQGAVVSQSRSGLPRISDTASSRPVQVQLPVVHGGQAAVARAVYLDQPDVALALRVQAVATGEDRNRQMERLLNMLTVSTAARQRPDRYPAVLPVLESFVLSVPGAHIPTTVPIDEHELWCDVMPWCPQNLNGWHETGPQHPGTTLAAFLPVLATLNAVHDDLGIIHRDITPANVMVDERGRLLLADWGIAHGLAADRTSTQTQLIGNRGFSLPPEMLAGDPSVGRYTDGWYLGSLLAWMLTGQPPGPQHGETWLPPGIPDNPSGQRVSAVIQGLCWPDPRQRMALPQAFEHLSDVTAGRPSRLPAPTTMPVTLPVTADPGTTQVMTGTGPTHVFAPPTVPPQPPARRSWATAAVVAAAVVIVVLVAALVWTSGLVGSGGDPSTADPGAGGGSQPSVAASDLCWTDDDTVPCPAYKPGEAVLNTFLLDEERTGLPLPACEARYEMIVPETFYYLLCGWDEDQAGCPEDEWECGMIRLRYFDDMDTMRGYLSWAGYEESPSTPGLRPHDDKGTPVAATVYVLDDPDELFAVAYCYDAFPFCMDIQSNDKDAIAAIADRFVTAPDSYVQQLTAYLEAHPV